MTNRAHRAAILRLAKNFSLVRGSSYTGIKSLVCYAPVGSSLIKAKETILEDKEYETM